MAVDAPTVQPEQSQHIVVLSEDDCTHMGVNSAKECFRLFKRGQSAQRHNGNPLLETAKWKMSTIAFNALEQSFSIVLVFFHPEFCSFVF